MCQLEQRGTFSLKNLSAHSLAFYLNLRHACLHGTRLLYFQLSAAAGCEHPTWGARHPSYCKLPAVAEALSRGFERVVFLDSDAFLRDADLDVEALLRKYGGGASQPLTPRDFSPAAGSAVAGAAIMGRITPVAFCAIFALSSAVGPIIGQNAGAGLYDSTAHCSNCRWRGTHS